jgi:hypothetical protein
VEIRDEDEGPVGFLERHAVLQGADEVAQVQWPGRPITRQRAQAIASKAGRAPCGCLTLRQLRPQLMTTSAKSGRETTGLAVYG